MTDTQSVYIVAGTRTKSGSTNFMRLHVMGDSRLEGARFQINRDQESVKKPKKVAARKPKTYQRFPSPNPPKISNQ